MSWDSETERVLRQDEREMARRASAPLVERIRDADRHARAARGYGIIEGEATHLRIVAECFADEHPISDDLLPNRPRPIVLLDDVVA